LRIEVIGRADDDDAAFYRSVVYKGTSTNGGPFSFARFDSNYDMQRDKLRVAAITEDTNDTPAAGTPPQQGIQVADASLFERGQTIIVTQGKAPGALREVRIISDVELANNIIRVSQDLTNTYTANSGAQVRAASTLMTTLLNANFNADADATPGEAFETMNAEGVGLPVQRSQNGMYFGGGVALEGGGLFELSQKTPTIPLRRQCSGSRSNRTCRSKC
jgi:hypothetical protein